MTATVPIPEGMLAAEEISAHFLAFYNTWPNYHLCSLVEFQCLLPGRFGRECTARGMQRYSLEPGLRQDFNSLDGGDRTTHWRGTGNGHANIKNVLAQNKGVEFNFCLANGTDWYWNGCFQDFWDNSARR